MRMRFFWKMREISQGVPISDSLAKEQEFPAESLPQGLPEYLLTRCHGTPCFERIRERIEMKRAYFWCHYALKSIFMCQ